MACVIWGVWLTALTEILSLFKAFHIGGLVAGWSLGCVLTGIPLLKSGGVDVRRIINVGSWRNLFNGSTASVLMFSAVAFILAVTGVIAFKSPPNTWDSLSYHMSRVLHWMQNASVAHYPAHEDRQLFMNPWAEFAITHFQILTQNDYFASLIQWFCSLGSVVAVSLIAAQFGLGRRAQLFSALVAATIPMGILQSTSTQTDYAVGFWLVVMAYFVVKAAEENTMTPDTIFGVGASLGLAILTKPTGYIYGFPLLLWYAWIEIRSFRLNAWKAALAVILLVLAINAGHYGRNYRLYGSPLASTEEGSLAVDHSVNKAFSPAVLASSVLKNIGLHLGTPFDNVNAVLEKIIYQAHGLLHLRVNDPRTTVEELDFKVLPINAHEDRAGNLIHLVLMIVALALMLCAKRPRPEKVYVYLGVVIAAFLMNCLLLKWSPFRSRYHLPLFILWAPLFAWAFSRMRTKTVIPILAAVLFVPSLWWLGGNESRPVFGARSVFRLNRMKLYFNNERMYQSAYIQAVAHLRMHDYRKLGLIWYGDGWEYVLWQLMKDAMGEGIWFEHVDVEDNPSGKIPLKPFDPDAYVFTINSVSRDVEKFERYAHSNLNPVATDIPALAIVGRKK